MLANELDEPLGALSPVLREPFKVLKGGRDAALAEQLDGILGVLVEVGVEDALVLEIQVLADVEKLPAQIMQLQRIQNPRIVLNRCLNSSPVFADRLFAARYDFGDDREAVARGSARENRPVPPPLFFEVTSFGDRHGGGLGPVLIDHGHVGSFLEPDAPHSTPDEW